MVKMNNLTPGADMRAKENRTEVFLQFYDFHLRHRAHPGCVYALFPWLAEHFNWTDEEALWFAFINGNTQNPVTSLLLHEQGRTPAAADKCVAFWNANYTTLDWDTDRRYHKKDFDKATASYVKLMGSQTQAAFWQKAKAGGWEKMWDTVTGIYTFGRLSSWSYAEYLYIYGFGCDADDMMLADKAGSRSHRNGLCIVSGLEEYDWHQSNPSFDGVYDPALLADLEVTSTELLNEARRRAKGKPYYRDVTRLTLESTLCTYKGWHRPRRRYAGVYIDMLHDRLNKVASRWNHDAVEVVRQARQDIWPSYLLLEETPNDPGLHEIKQDWYRLTGEVPVLGHEEPVFWSGFDDNVKAGLFGARR
jgi:hypothetical protein